ncbi:MAG: Maf family nucleotide pyrophosphatase [Fulvivirga sp.]|nr:Maf family nucleotide pyrophosphatase [Fulvivirga sp.]
MNFKRPLILASKSPRRQQLLKDAGFTFDVKSREVDEAFPKHLPVQEVARYLATKKADAFTDELKDQVVITADTVVIIEEEILEKPKDNQEAFEMLQKLSGKRHQVITGVCIKDQEKSVSFDDTTTVFFKQLTEDEIKYYVNKFQPFDKAGAYGIQEWIGMIGIEQIEGSYFNVVGLPIHKVYAALMDF